jgi:hypothetical protein
MNDAVTITDNRSGKRIDGPIEDGAAEQKIVRPRQLYVGTRERGRRRPASPICQTQALALL